MLNMVRAWILLSASLVSTGWILSAFHQLNRRSYGIVFVLAAITIFSYRKKIRWPTRENFARMLYKISRRLKRPAPLFFLILALLSLGAGIFYIPANADSNAYRIPRVLQWLGAGQWHWIHTLDLRMNIAGCNFEWLSAPLIL